MNDLITEEPQSVMQEEVKRIDLAGFEVARREYFSHMKEAMLTIRPDGVTFNASCIAKMPDVVYIQILVSKELKMIVIRKCEENDKDSQRWCVVKGDKRKSRKITGKPFASRCYKMMGWSKANYFKVCGTRAMSIDDDGDLMYAFDLQETEIYLLTEKARTAAGVTDEEMMKAKESMPNIKKPGARLQSGSEDSFGTAALEHKDQVELHQLDLFEAWGAKTEDTENA